MDQLKQQIYSWVVMMAATILKISVTHERKQGK